MRRALSCRRSIAAGALALVSRAAPLAAQPRPTPAPRTAPAAEQGITVRSRRGPIAREPTRHALEREELRTAAGTAGDALRAIQNLPGFARAPFLSGSLIVRGASPMDTQAFIDGTVLPVLYHFGGLGSTLPTEALERIDVYPANFSARYGRAIGAVVDVGLRAPRRRGWRAVANLGVLDVGAFVEGAIGRNVSVTLAARYGWIGPLLGALSEQFGNGTRFALGFGDYQAVLEWRPLPTTRVRLAVLGSEDALDLRTTGSSTALMTNTTLRYHLAQAAITHDLPRTGVRLTGSLAVAITGAHMESPTASVAIDSVPVHARYELSVPLAPGGIARFDMGADVIVGPASIGLMAPPPGLPRDLPIRIRVSTSGRATIYQPGVFAELTLAPAAGLRLIAGARLDYFRDVYAAMLTPRAALRWTPAPGWTVKAGVGLFSQPPRFTENAALPLLALANAAGAIVSVGTLRVQRAMHYSLGVEREVVPGVTVSLEGFYRGLDDILVGVPTIDNLLVGTSPPVSRIAAVGDGYAVGLEVLVRARLLNGRLSGWLAYTLMRAERRDGPGLPWRPYEFDQTHNLAVLANYDLGAGWFVGARFRLVSGNTYTPVLAWLDTDRQVYTRYAAAPNSARLPTFHQLDLRAEKRFRVARRATISVYLELINAYWAPNVEGVQYNSDASQVRYTPSLPLIPNFGVRGEL